MKSRNTAAGKLVQQITGVTQFGVWGDGVAAITYVLVGGEHYPRFIELLACQGRSLLAYVRRKFEDFLKCGILEHGFLRVRCQDCRSERLVAFSCKRRGYAESRIR